MATKRKKKRPRKKPPKKHKVYFIEDNKELHESLMGCIEARDDALWNDCDFKRFKDVTEALQSSAVPPDVVCVDAGSIHVHSGCYTQFALRAIMKLAERWSSATYLIYSALGGVVDLDWVVAEFKERTAGAGCIGTCQDIEWALTQTLGLD